MKRLFLYLLCMTLGFSTGLAAYKFWPTSIPPTEINRPLTVSICELNRDPAQYDGKLVQVRAVLHGGVYGGGIPYIVDESCGSLDDHVPKLLEVYVDPNQAVPILPEWATYTTFCGNDTYGAMVYGMTAEVNLAGTFDGREFRIIPRSVFLLSPASKGH
jgi:hypothetical protein